MIARPSPPPRSSPAFSVAVVGTAALAALVVPGQPLGIAVPLIASAMTVAVAIDIDLQSVWGRVYAVLSLCLAAMSAVTTAP